MNKKYVVIDSIFHLRFVFFVLGSCEMPSHEECRKRVCLLCFKKSKDMRILSEKMWIIIEKFIVQGIDRNDDRLPCALCSTCSRVIREFSVGNFTRHINVERIEIQKVVQTRQTTREGCSCIVCQTATSMPSNICKSINVSSARKSRGRPPLLPSSSSSPSSSSVRKPVAMKLCSYCLTKLTKKCSHVCTKFARLKNLRTLALNDSPKFKDNIQRSDVSIECAVEDETASKSLQLTMATSNSSKDLFEESSQTLLSAEQLSIIQDDLSLSNRQVLKLAGHVRAATSKRASIERNLKDKLSERNHCLDNYFIVESDLFIIRQTESECKMENRCIIKAENVNELINEVKHIRGKQYKNAKIGLDGGGSFLKVCLTLMNYTEEQPQTPKRRAYADGIMSKRGDGSVKRVIILALVPDIPENYRNILNIWIKLGLDKMDLPFVITADLKLSNIMLGLMAHGSTHPCTWCDISKDQMLLGRCGDLRTLGSLRKMFWRWLEAGGKLFGNVIHLPICKGPDDVLVLDLFPPPELHLLIGPVTTMVDALQRIWPDAEKWIELANVQRQAYHGGVLNGNGCMKLLQHINILEDSLKCPQKQFIAAFHAFKAVVDACYGMNLGDFREAILEFSSAYTALEIRITPKVHAVMFHVRDFCERNTSGLGIWSEQSTESLHSDFDKTWQRYKVSGINSNYSTQLLKAVRDYNSKHALF